MKILITFLVVIASNLTVIGQDNTFRLWGVGSSLKVNHNENGRGFLYNINPDGTDFQVAKRFNQTIEGAKPSAPPIKASDGFLYGVMREGGADDLGIIYRMAPDGSGYTKIYEFALDGKNGAAAGLVEGQDGKLYGLTRKTPQFEEVLGRIYSINKDGTGFDIVYTFADYPHDVLMIGSDNFLYGATASGGNNSQGVLYKIGTNGAGYKVLRHLEYDELSIQRSLQGSLTEGDDGLIYGAFWNEGLFRMSKDGENFQMIHQFSNTKGQWDYGFLLSGRKIFGVTQIGGSNDKGVLYSINQNGSGFSRLVDFAKSVGKGITLGSNGKLYGAYTDGSFYEVDPDGSDLRQIYQHDVVSSTWSYSMIEISPDIFIGVTLNSGASQNGIIYKLTVNGNFDIIKDFPVDGYDPATELLSSGDFLYGQTVLGGAKGFGAIFKIRKDGSDYSEIYSSLTPSWPSQYYFSPTPLSQHNDLLFGADSRGIYQIGKDGDNFSYVREFAGSIEGSPTGNIVINDNFLYGVTRTPYGGKFYKIDLTNSGFTVLFDFEDNPVCFPTNLAIAGDRFLITTWKNSGPDRSAIYSINSNGTTLKKIKNADDLVEIGRNNPILGSDGQIYGTYFYQNFFYSMNQDGSNLVNFTFNTQTNGVGSVIEPRPGKLFFVANRQIYKFNMADKKSSIVGPKFGVMINSGVTSLDKEVQTVTIGDIEPKTFGDEPFEIVASSSLGLELAFSSSNTNVAVINGTTITIIGAGTATIKADQKGTIAALPAYAETLLTVAKAIQIVTIDDINAKLYGDEPFKVSASSSHGLVITLSSSNTNVAVVEGNIVTIVGVGTTMIRAYQEGTNSITEAFDETELSVTGPLHTVIIDEIDPKTFGDEPFEVSAKSSQELDIIFSSDNPDVAVVEGNLVTIVGAGTANIKAHSKGTIRIPPADDEGVLSVAKAVQTITFEQEDVNELDQKVTLLATSTSGLELVFSSSSPKINIKGNVIAILEAGRISVMANQTGDKNYLPAETAEANFCINPRKPTISLSGTTAAPQLVSSSSLGNQWYLDDSNVPVATSKSFAVIQDGNYTLRTTIDDCMSEISESVGIIIVGFEETIDAEVTVFPNPAAAEIYLHMPTGSNVSMIDVVGKVLEQRITRSHEETFDVKSLGAGIYFFRIEMGDKVVFWRFSKI